MAPVWARSSNGLLVVVTGELLPRPLSSMNRQLELPHRRLTQRAERKTCLLASSRQALIVGFKPPKNRSSALYPPEPFPPVELLMPRSQLLMHENTLPPRRTA